MTDEGLEEERRLFYVAVTRAKNELALVYPMLARDRYGVDVILEPSRFVAELPPEVYERWTVEMEAESGQETAPEERVRVIPLFPTNFGNHHTSQSTNGAADRRGNSAR